jgi:hypothetical protein
MEQAFEQLIEVILGRPGSREEIPANVTFAATLLILREFMHDLHFISITVKGGYTSRVSGEIEKRQK